MSYKTLDGFDLNEGDSCFISLQCLTGEHSVSAALRPAFYRDKTAKENGWDFTRKNPMKIDCDDCACEVIGVWKYKPGKADK